MIQLAHTLDLRTVVEGVEKSEQLLSLRRMGCDVGQGHLFARPIPAEEVPDFLRDWDGIDGLVKAGDAVE